MWSRECRIWGTCWVHWAFEHSCRFHTGKSRFLAGPVFLWIAEDLGWEFLVQDVPVFVSTKAALTHLRRFVWNLYHSTWAQHSSIAGNLGEFWMPDKTLIGAWVVAGISMAAILLLRRLAEPCKLWWTNKLDKDNKQARKQKTWGKLWNVLFVAFFVANPMRIDNSNLFLGLKRKADGLEIKCKKEASLLWQLIEQRQRAAGFWSGTEWKKILPIVARSHSCGKAATNGWRKVDPEGPYVALATEKLHFFSAESLFWRF